MSQVYRRGDVDMDTSVSLLWHSSLLYQSGEVRRFYTYSVPVCISARSGSCACTCYTPGWPSLACSWWFGLAVQKRLSEGRKQKVTVRERWFWIQDVMWKKYQWRLIPVLLAVMVKYWSDANVQGNYHSPGCYLLVIWKQISHLLLPAITAHVPSKGAEDAVYNLIILVCRLSLAA